MRLELERASDAAGHSMSTELELLLRIAMKARSAAANEIDRIFELAWDEARQVIAEHGGTPPSQSAQVYSSVVAVLEAAILKVPKPGDEPAPQPTERHTSTPPSRGRKLDLEAGAGGHSDLPPTRRLRRQLEIGETGEEQN